KKFNKPPALLCNGFAAYLLFMKAVRKDGNSYFGARNGESYPIQDDSADVFYKYWNEADIDDTDSLERLVNAVCGNAGLWGTDLNSLPGFASSVFKRLQMLIHNPIS